ncbi:hypothetical protein [Halobacillus litoralis]|uniref:hypothetical protein n=1 Tax=Halobacillus TaxID=45667 RepID=UPI0013E8D6AC|nr:hypothetical protein [Halobacillus litoralis]
MFYVTLIVVFSLIYYGYEKKKNFELREKEIELEQRKIDLEIIKSDQHIRERDLNNL